MAHRLPEETCAPGTESDYEEIHELVRATRRAGVPLKKAKL